MAKIQTGDPIDLNTMSKAEAKVGEIKSSMLDLATFNSENLGTWYLCDGQNSTSGTLYETMTGEDTVPDMRGRVQRMKDHGAGEDADGERDLGHNQEDAMQRITGNIDMHSVWPQGESGVFSRTSSGSGSHYGSGNVGWPNYAFDSAGSTSPSAAKTNDAETRVKNTCVNFYVKVGY